MWASLLGSWATAEANRHLAEEAERRARKQYDAMFDGQWRYTTLAHPRPAWRPFAPRPGVLAAYDRAKGVICMGCGKKKGGRRK